MKPGVPWSIKGIEPELREAAKVAAHRSGMTLGEWLNSAINEQAGAHDDAANEAPRGRGGNPRASNSIERAASKLEDIAEKLARLQPETEGSYRANQQLDSQVNFAKILSRVESHEKQTVEAFSAVNERLANISKQVTRHQPGTPKVEESASYQALEKAVRNIIEHLDVSDKRTRENMKTLQDRMTEMSQRMGGNDQMLRQAPAFSALETRLAELSRKVEQPGQTPGDQLRSEIEQLATRIDTVRESSEQLASRAQTQAVQAAQSELRAIEGRLINLLNEAKQSIMANHVGPAELQRFKGEIDKLHARIDEAQRGAASDRDVSALKVAIEQLSTRIAQNNDPKPMADLDRRILEIADKLERAEQQGLGSTMTSEVERRFAELDQRLSQANVPAAMGHDEKLQEMDDRLARTEQQLTHLDTIERAIAQLYESVEESRRTPAVTEGAAPIVSLAASPEIMALENGLKAVREAAESADHRNQETLEAVHETLEQIVSKLAEIETAASGRQVAAAVSSPAAATNPFEAKEEPQIRNPFLTEEPELEPDAAKPGQEAAKEANPFEPAAEAVAEAPATPPGDGSISDLIAAARRLHQQNNPQSSSLSSFAPGKAKGKDKAKEKSGKSFSLPFLSSLSSGAGKSKAKPAAGKIANGNEAGSKRGLVFLGIFLLAIATFATTNMLSRHSSTPPAQPVSIQQPATPPAAAPAADPQASQASPIPVPGANAPSTAAPAAGQVPPLPDPAPAPLANPGQQSDASDSLLQTDPITTGSITSTKGDANVAVLDPSVGPAKLRDAATNGDNTAQFIIATHYLNGDTTPQNYNKAAYWYGKAATAGLAPAQYRLATMYERGTGVEKNLNTALKWYEQAGAMGNVKAMHNAAVIAAGADAGGPDYAKAFKWFSLAASHGLKDSEFNLAVLMERGLGTKQDTAEALFWYMAAAGQDDADAKARVAVLTKAMTPTTVDAVKQRFKAWVPEKAPDAANVVAVNDAQWNPSKAPANKTSMNTNDQAKGLLGQLGYRVGELDGTLDARTASAIKLFQIREGLKATGKVTPDLLDRMQVRVG